MAGKTVYAPEAGSPPAYMQGQKSLTCRYCGEGFDSMPRLAAHISHYHSEKRRKSREEEIIRLLQEILQEIRGLRNDLKGLRVTEYRRRVEEKVTEIKQEKPHDKKLPSFLHGNPWVEILSRRAESD